MWARELNPAISAPENLHFQLALRDDDCEHELSPGTRSGRRRKPSKKKKHLPTKYRFKKTRPASVPAQPLPTASSFLDPDFDKSDRADGPDHSGHPDHPDHADHPHHLGSSNRSGNSKNPGSSHKSHDSPKGDSTKAPETKESLDRVADQLQQLPKNKSEQSLEKYSEKTLEKKIEKKIEKQPATFQARKMATQEEHHDGRQQYAFVEGNFAELAQDMANHLGVGDEVKALIEKDEQDEVLKRLIIASSALHSIPEKEFTANYNLLIYLVLQSSNVGMLLPRVCENLMKPVTSSPVHGPALALQALTTIFNLLQQENERDSALRFNVFMAILRFIKLNGMYDNVKKALPNIKEWLKQWKTDEEDQRKLFLEIAEVAHDAGDDETSYQHVLSALRTFDEDKVKSEEAQQLALRALKTALLTPAHNDFQDLLAVPAIQALSDSQPLYFELLTIFAEKDLEDYNDFNDEHEGFIEKEHLDGEKLQRKIRLLTFASLAASTPNREIPYSNIAKALQIPSEEVEMWTIDVIRAGLVEGKLSQLKQVFLVHKTFYRVFGEKQWREVYDRLEGWKNVIANVTANLRREQANAEAHKKRETEELERRLANAGVGGSSGGGGGSGGRRGGGDRGDRGDRGERTERAPRRERTDDDD